MSWQASQWAILQPTGSASAKAVLLVLAEAAGAQTAACWLSHEVIAQRADVDRRTVVRQMKRLSELGLIARERRVNEHGHRTSDLVTLQLVAQSDTLSLGPDANLSLQEERLSDNDSAPKATFSACPSDRLAQEPVTEPVLEPEVRERRSPETTIPLECPSAGDLTWAYERVSGLPIDVELEAEKFRSHAGANDRKARDWSQAWRSWILKSVEYAQKPSPRQANIARYLDSARQVAGWSAMDQAIAGIDVEGGQ